jgi:DNA-directed RNA polymerase subunit RPC12/RpoP
MIKEYKCTWCGNEFERDVNYVQSDTKIGSNPPVPGHKQSISDQVKCYKCGNFISTWDRIEVDGKKIKVRR